MERDRASGPSVPIADAAADFLAQRRIAVAGVSRNPKGESGNTIYTRLRDRGYDVVAVNPNADEVEGDPCYHSVPEIPDGVDAVVIATRPEVASTTMQECIDAGVSRVWLHRAFGDGSVDADAVVLGRAHGVTVIDGGCPLMFPPTSDFGHRIIRVMCRRRVPTTVT
jgi:predicted CoA-binding protein